MDPALIELLFTIAACLSLGMLLVAAAAVLPWREEELDEVGVSFGALVERLVARPAEVLRRAL